MEYGSIIFLNGTSSSGKSTLAKALQQQLEESYIHMALDDVWAGLPEKIIRQDAWWEKFPLGKYASGFHRAVAGFSRAGVGVIIDHCCTSSSGLQECLTLFKKAHVVFVEVTCTVDELRKREENRGDRLIGQAEAQLADFEEFRSRHLYDLQIDTSAHTPSDCARKIVEVLSDARKKTAFDKMRKQNSQPRRAGDSGSAPLHRRA